MPPLVLEVQLVRAPVADRDDVGLAVFVDIGHHDVGRWGRAWIAHRKKQANFHVVHLSAL